MEILKFISIFFFASFVGSAPPGLVNLSVAKVVLNKNKKNAYIAAAGACVALFLQGMIGILMAKYIIKQSDIQANMLKIGVVIFALLTIYFLVVAIRNKPIKTKVSSHDSKKSFAKGFFISVLNVLPIPYYIIISSQIRTDMMEYYSWPKILIFSLAITSAMFLVLSIYITAFVKMQKRTNVMIKYANFIMAGMMFIIFLITLIRVLYG